MDIVKELEAVRKISEKVLQDSNATAPRNPLITMVVERDAYLVKAHESILKEIAWVMERAVKYIDRSNDCLGAVSCEECPYPEKSCGDAFKSATNRGREIIKDGQKIVKAIEADSP